MEKLLLSIIVASGLCAASHVKRQYHFVYRPLNYTEAQHYCRETYTDLATIDSMEDVELLESMAERDKMGFFGFTDRVWIGLYDDVDSWRWSLSDASFYKDGETEFRKWRPGDPNNYDGKERCGAIIYNSEWDDFSCEGNLFVGACMDVTGPNVTFVLTNSTMTWSEAQRYCRANHTDLASVRNEDDNEKIFQILGYGHTIWIGLYRDSWKWSDGSNQSFQYWAPRSPENSELNEACGAADFSQSGKWEDWGCQYRRGFICHSLVPVSRQVVKVKLKMKNSSLDPNDPVVMENMLEKLKHRLKDQGLDENVKLSWRKQTDGKVFHKEKKETESDSCRETEL